MDEASRHYVHLDELMDGVGRRLGELTKAEWGIVTAGCAAALTHATAACIAGANPEKMQRLPDLDGLKNEVVMPRESRNVYDHAIRMLGVKMITPATREEFLGSLRPNTAMVALLGESVPRHPMPLEEMTAAAKKMGIPVIVDAAAERLTIPNVYLTKGVDMVAYSGGKCLRGPQCAGLLLGRKDLLQAAWLNSAPHHAFGRSLKVGKEEIMGMLAAAEAWVKRDHEKEWKEWEGWLATIREKVSSIPGVRTEMLQPRGPSNYAPQLRVLWSFEKVGLTGNEALDLLLSGEPRVIVSASDEVNQQGEASLTVMPYMMMPGDDRIAAGRIHQVLSKPPHRDRREDNTQAQIAGQWDVDIEYLRGSAHHKLFLEQNGQTLTGNHRGETIEGDVRGSIKGNRATFRSGHRYEGTTIGYRFEGTWQSQIQRAPPVELAVCYFSGYRTQEGKCLK
jgi:L-seryl-tRNA(Ser) seleniumtransferase